ncbi:MAG TPA: TIM-barrel domain-containing protein [Ornithinimicrobium sp.]|uniref:glycoside hydrolase family 31 protein n=1 Tax=Ornithinimicrobium sp. TaxID=1977084 RepID=UPI002B4A0E8E|nr:TIM-barrel domain-containing protein [Ornithinimicrobium sp.]HKJ12702.1 TIM-barrel domain-containing protein [Ornithinimicrobium sp.]
MTSGVETQMLWQCTGVRAGEHRVDLDVSSTLVVGLGRTPGWLNGEPLVTQGVETAMPNLPHLALPDLVVRTWTVRVEPAGPRGFRILVAEPGASVFEEGVDASWLGIVTDPRASLSPREGAGPDVLSLQESPDEIVLTASSGHRLVVGRLPFSLTLLDPEGLVLTRTSHRLRQVAGLPTAPSVLATHSTVTLQLELAPQELITGFGEQFGGWVKNGQRLFLRVEDALGTGTGMAYKPVPVWHGAGWSGFLNTGASVSADVGHSLPSVLSLEVHEPVLDLFLLPGPDLPSRLSDYTALTGRGHEPPDWAFGYWVGRCRYLDATQMLDVADSMREHQVPCDVLHLDPNWLIVDRLSTDFIWNTDRFGSRAAFVAALAERNMRLSVWELPYLDPASPMYLEAAEGGHLVLTTHGDVATVEGTPTPDGRPRALIDLSAEHTRAWWLEKHRAFIEDGVAVFKTDFGEGLPDDAVLGDGTPAAHAHNLFPLRYNGAVHDGIGVLTGRTPLVWGRSGWAGSQRYPGQWGGDAESTVAGMSATLRGGLSYAVSAPGLWSHDIGGFFGPELTTGLYVRWTQFGALSPLMRTHGLRPREPWAFGEDALAICRSWIRLRYSLLRYLLRVAADVAEHGWPMLRPLSFHYPDDPVAERVDDQFMLGPDLLVVPIFDDGLAPVSRRYYVPEGGWRDMITGSRWEGPAWVREEVPLERMPVLVRDGVDLGRVEIDETVRCVEDVLARIGADTPSGDG